MEEKEREKTRPKGPGDDGPIEENPKTEDGKAAKEGEDLKKGADEAKKDLEHYRRRSREKAARIEAEDSQPREKYRQKGGQ